MPNIVDIEDYKPHMVVETIDGNVHVMPVQLIKNWISGDVKFEDSEDWEVVVRTILKDWLDA